LKEMFGTFASAPAAARRVVGYKQELDVHLDVCRRRERRLTKKRMEPAGSGATWTGSPEGGFSGRKHHKPRQALDNNTAGVREREDMNRTRVAGHLDEIQGVVANTLNLIRNGAVGFIDWLGRRIRNLCKL
jgi:hypothetical protein